jgi:hypothetical protein
MNGLAAKPLNGGSTEITEDTKIMVSDLTQERHLFMKAVYNKWIDKVVEGKVSADNYKLLDKVLKKIRDTNINRKIVNREHLTDKRRH